MPSEITEARLQSECFTWHWNTYPKERGKLLMFYNNPRNAIQGAMLKGMGMQRGPSDLVYFHNDKSVTFLECKLPGQYQKKEQKDFEKRMTTIGHSYFVFKDVQQFKEIFKQIYNDAN